jgi:signal transduction histidine kinase
MIVRSLRARIFVASLLWSAGLIAFAHLAFILAAHMYPRIIHIRLQTIFIWSLICLVAGLLLVRSTLSRVATLHGQLARVRKGELQRVEGTYPSEVEPLVNELNALLDHREETVRRALAKAADLAHGLKTPLAVIAHESNDPMIRQQIERMQRQIDFHLAHARAAGSAATLGARSVVAESVDGLSRTLQRLHAARGIAIDSRVPAAHAVRVQREDLDEMLGNLLDNGCKWARSRVAVGSMVHDASVIITVDDDGPGLDPALYDSVLQRGVRADEAASGSGLGLAIVRDLAELYGGSIALEGSPLGGLTARLELPAAG